MSVKLFLKSEVAAERANAKNANPFLQSYRFRKAILPAQKAVHQIRKNG